MTKYQYVFNLILACAVLLFSACDDDNTTETPQEGKHNFIISNLVGESMFFTTFKDLSQNNIDNASAYEHIAEARIYQYEDIILIAEAVWGNNIFKYTLDENGRMSPAGQLPFLGLAPGDVTFVSKEKAYVSLYAIGKLAIINPTTMKQEGEIDLRQHAVGDNNPDPGTSIIRGDKLFLALNQQKTEITAHDSAYVAVIDINTDQVIKVIVDPRTTSTGQYAHHYPFMDDNNNIYFYSWCQFGTHLTGNNDGFLRINNGNDEWDASYHFSIAETSLPGVPNNQGLFIIGMEYVGNNELYAVIEIPAWASNPPDFVNTRDYQAFKLNLETKEVVKIDVPPTAGWSSWGVIKNDNKIIFALSTSSANGLYTYDLGTKTASSTPIVNIPGLPNKILYIGD